MLSPVRNNSVKSTFFASVRVNLQIVVLLLKQRSQDIFPGWSLVASFRISKMMSLDIFSFFCAVSFSRHFNYHPFIPDQNGTYRSAMDIHRHCASEIYHWCRSLFVCIT
ncbi:hypothetical protein V1525DRAFT_414034 [Lipomyces kononenkoae]|uniref:Uncharacterized protein n=1 Tax=Lipomyces kononenkoae TaxID=34357 RepID=A0ACC3SRZ8_LIPKO